jgi:hypothetical protein
VSARGRVGGIGAGAGEERRSSVRYNQQEANSLLPVGEVEQSRGALSASAGLTRACCAGVWGSRRVRRHRTRLGHGRGRASCQGLSSRVADPRGIRVQRAENLVTGALPALSRVSTPMQCAYGARIERVLSAY